MKRTVVWILCCAVLFSCAEHTLDKTEKRLPVLERHFNLETGEAIGEKSFEYDRYRNLIRETYKPLTSKAYQYGVYGYEIQNEYDAQHKRILMFTRYFGDQETYSLIRYVYDGEKMIEEQYYGGDLNIQSPHTKVKYYYSGSLADSSLNFQQFYGADDFRFGGASYFKYDNDGKLMEEQRRFFDGTMAVMKINNYDGDLIKESCNPVAGQEGVFNCTRYDYNSQKDLIRKYATFTGMPDRLLEEHIYVEGLLKETKIFNQNYYQQVYAAPASYTLQIRYEY